MNHSVRMERLTGAVTRPPNFARAAGLLFLIAGLADCHADATAPLARLEVSGKKVMFVGTTQTMTVTGFAASDAGVTLPRVTWSSSDPSVITVSAGGIVHAIAPGSATVSAQAGSVIGWQSITVTRAPAQVTIVAPTSLVPGFRAILSVVVLDSSGSQIVPADVAWTSSNSQVASISTVDAHTWLTGVSPGSVVVHAAVGDVVGSAAVTVVDLNADVSMSITPNGEFGDTLQVAPAQSLRLEAHTYNSHNGNVVDAGPVVWSSDRPDVATVSANGVVTGVAAGSAGIRASTTDGHVSAARPIKVAATAGVVWLRLVHAAQDFGPITLEVSNGKPVSLGFGDIREQQVPAGTLQVLAPEVPDILAQFSPLPETQRFTGFLPADTHVTVFATNNADLAPLFGPITFAPFWDYPFPVAADSVIIQVVLAMTRGGYNVYFTPVGFPISVPYLQGCYLDFPYGVTENIARAKGSFDIVLQPGKQFGGQEARRFTVTPEPGHATTYVITGPSPDSLRVLPVITR